MTTVYRTESNGRSPAWAAALAKAVEIVASSYHEYEVRSMGARKPPSDANLTEAIVTNVANALFECWHSPETLCPK